MNDERAIQTFLNAPSFAVVGASNDPEKYGYKVMRVYQQRGLRAFPVNPRETEILGETAFPSLGELPEPVESISVITPPPVTERVVEEAAKVGVRSIWMQPGAESPAAIRRAEELGMEVIAGGPCILVVLGYHGA